MSNGAGRGHLLQHAVISYFKTDIYFYAHHLFDIRFIVIFECRELI